MPAYKNRPPLRQNHTVSRRRVHGFNGRERSLFKIFVGVGAQYDLFDNVGGRPIQRQVFIQLGQSRCAFEERNAARVVNLQQAQLVFAVKPHAFVHERIQLIRKSWPLVIVPVRDGADVQIVPCHRRFQFAKCCLHSDA